MNAKKFAEKYAGKTVVLEKGLFEGENVRVVGYSDDNDLLVEHDGEADGLWSSSLLEDDDNLTISKYDLLEGKHLWYTNVTNAKPVENK